MSEIAAPAEPPPPPPPVDRPAHAEKAIEDLAKNYRDQFSASTARTGTTLLSWGAALLILLVQPLGPLFYKAQQLSRLDMKIKEGKSALSQSSATRGAQSAIWNSSLVAESAQVEKNSSTLTSELDKLQKVKTPLGELELPALYIPPLYSLLLAGFAAYLLHRRLVLNAMALKVVYLHLDVLGRDANNLRGFGAWAPFWLAPLPRLVIDGGSTEVPGADQARIDFLGWRHSLQRNTAWFWVMIAALGVIWIRVIVLARQLDMLRGGRPSIWIRWETHTLLLLAITIVFAFYVRPIVSWGAFPEKLVVDNKARRTFLVTAMAGTAAFAGLAILPNRFLRYLPFLRSPRFRRKRHRQSVPLTAMRDQTVRVMPSGAIRYADHDGWIIGRPALEINRFGPVAAAGVDEALNSTRLLSALDTMLAKQKGLQREPAEPFATVQPSTPSGSQPQPPQQMPERPTNPIVEPSTTRAPEPSKPAKNRYRLDSGTAGTICERLAQRACRRNGIKAAVAFLWKGILLDTMASFSGSAPNYRLYDLFTGLVIRGGLQEDVEKNMNLVAHVAKFWPTDNKLTLIAHRLANPPEPWAERWKKTSLRWLDPAPPGKPKPRVRRKRSRSPVQSEAGLDLLK